MISKERTIETLEITEDNTVILRERVAIIEDGEEISHHYEQRNFKAGADVSGENEKVQKVFNALHAE